MNGLHKVFRITALLALAAASNLLLTISLVAAMGMVESNVSVSLHFMYWGLWVGVAICLFASGAAYGRLSLLPAFMCVGVFAIGMIRRDPGTIPTLLVLYLIAFACSYLGLLVKRWLRSRKQEKQGAETGRA